MATLLLGAVGTLLGGPLGGAIGALAGRQIDNEIFGPAAREGPRVKDLAISTSSYGQPIPRHFGQMRTAGTIVWATDLSENGETSGGGKGQPETTTYSYSISFAVLLSSYPIDSVGRIWADGNLLRGDNGDLKSGGTMRFHSGHRDQPPDPLLAGALGEQCPAHRGGAYVVFEDLALGDFGNRIPALTFEIFAGEGQDVAAQLIELAGGKAAPDLVLPRIAGFSYEGGAIADVLALLARLTPLTLDTGATPIRLEPADADSANTAELSEAAAWGEGEFGQQSGQSRRRALEPAHCPEALRYYDLARDYQPAIQRADGPTNNGTRQTLEFPFAMAAADARTLIRAAVVRSERASDTVLRRVAQLVPAIAPGRFVRAQDMPGIWRVQSWEWRERGIELELERFVPSEPVPAQADAGAILPPRDRSLADTLLRGFELPWNGIGSTSARQVFAAVSADAGQWSGASLYAERGGALIPLKASGGQRAVTGTLLLPLGPSPALILEDRASATIRLATAEMAFTPASNSLLAGVANRLLVGNEVLQFRDAEPISETDWRIAGLLRGRGGTEDVAGAAHPAGSAVTLLDERLVTLDPAAIDPQTDRLAAIGAGESQPVSAPFEGAGATRRPLTPVHPMMRIEASGAIQLGWTRRARGAWIWPDAVDVPLVEQSEAYEVGLGPCDSPAARWQTAEAHLAIDSAAAAALRAGHPGQSFWVRQIGSFARSHPLLLGTLS